MSSGNIDLQVVFQKSHEVSKIRLLQQEKSNFQNQNTMAELKEKFNSQEVSVKELDYLDKKNIDMEKGASGKSPGKDRKNKSKDKSEEDITEEKLLPYLGNNLDLHI